jgi:MoaA/NifB/PqqE/SkfB family radical SAM enzyme
MNNWPFIDNTGKIHLCCKNGKHKINNNNTIKTHSLKELYFSENYNNIRKMMLEEKEIKGCNICYDYEKDVNQDSFRNRSLRSLKSIKKELFEPYKDQKIRALDLRLGSTCNLTCVMCHPNDSSKWFKIYPEFAKEVKHMSDDHVDYTNKNANPSVLNWAEYDSSWENIFSGIDENLLKVYMAGGEPFYIKNFADYTLKLVDKAPNAKIDINTNATRLLTKKHLSLLAGKINLRISIDGFKEYEDYQRTGTTWDKKVEVIDEYVQYFNIVCFDLTITSITIRSIPKLVEFLTNRYPDIPILFRPVVNRPGLAINNLPDNLLQESKEFFDNLSKLNNINYRNIDQMNQILSAGYKNDKDILKRTVIFWDQLNTIRLESFDQQLSEWVYE